MKPKFVPGDLSCGSCMKNFSSQGHWRRHLKRFHSMKPLFNNLKDQVFVCDCGYASGEPDEWQDHAENCDQSPMIYEICWCSHQLQAHFTPDNSCGTPFGCDCKNFKKNDERRDGT